MPRSLHSFVRRTVLPDGHAEWPSSHCGRLQAELRPVAKLMRIRISEKSFCSFAGSACETSPQSGTCAR